jgi:hypothetical protein
MIREHPPGKLFRALCFALRGLAGQGGRPLGVMTGALMLYQPASVQRLLLVALSVIVLSLILVLAGAKGALIWNRT